MEVVIYSCLHFLHFTHVVIVLAGILWALTRKTGVLCGFDAENYKSFVGLNQKIRIHFCVKRSINHSSFPYISRRKKLWCQFFIKRKNTCSLKLMSFILKVVDNLFPWKINNLPKINYSRHYQLTKKNMSVLQYLKFKYSLLANINKKKNCNRLWLFYILNYFFFHPTSFRLTYEESVFKIIQKGK